MRGITCTRAPLPPGANCVIQVVYSPSAAIASVGSITITDNGAGSPQAILVTGTGIQTPPFQISTLSATPSVPAGKTAQYVLSVTSPVGFSQPVGLSCSAPATITCTVSPSDRHSDRNANSGFPAHYQHRIANGRSSELRDQDRSIESPAAVRQDLAHLGSLSR